MKPKKKKKTSKKSCIIHFSECTESHIIEINEDRFRKIQSIADKRKSEPPDSSARFNHICQQIPEEYISDCGYHR